MPSNTTSSLRTNTTDAVFTLIDNWINQYSFNNVISLVHFDDICRDWNTCTCNRTKSSLGADNQGPVVQSPISANPGLNLNKTCGVNPGLVLIGLWTTGPISPGMGFSSYQKRPIPALAQKYLAAPKLLKNNSAQKKLPTSLHGDLMARPLYSTECSRMPPC